MCQFDDKSFLAYLLNGGNGCYARDVEKPRSRRSLPRFLFFSHSPAVYIGPQHNYQQGEGQ
jgi:hypothetical protein